MKQFNFKKRDKIIVAAVGAAIFIFITWNFIYSTAHSKAQAFGREIRLEEANLTAGLEIKNRKSEILEEFNKYKDSLNILQDDSENKVMAMFSKEIEQIAQESGMSIIALSPQGEVGKVKEYKKYCIDLRAEGAPESAYNFLYKVQTSKLLIKLDKISIGINDPQKQLLRIETTISLTVI